MSAELEAWRDKLDDLRAAESYCESARVSYVYAEAEYLDWKDEVDAAKSDLGAAYASLSPADRAVADKERGA